MKKEPRGDAIIIRCPCHRGYLSTLYVADNGTSVAFVIEKGYFVMLGYCDSCNQMIHFKVNLADMLTTASKDWEANIVNPH